MEGLKEKLALMREELEKAEKREQHAKRETSGLRERISRASDEERAKKLQIKTMKKLLETVEDKTDEKLDRLERLNEIIHETEMVRMKLERKELKEDGTLNHLESRQRSRKIFVEEADQRHREALNKLMLAERETEKINARILAAKNNEAYFKKKLRHAGCSIRDLTSSEESKQVKCDEHEEIIHRLTEKKEKMLMTAESLERKVTQSEQTLIPLRHKTQLATRRTKEMKNKLRDMLDEINTYP